MSNRLLPVGSSPLEVAAAAACAELAAMPVPLRDLWDPATCPVNLLPYLAWAFSVDHWDETWTEDAKRSVVAAAFFIHRHKGHHRRYSPRGGTVGLPDQTARVVGNQR